MTEILKDIVVKAVLLMQKGTPSPSFSRRHVGESRQNGTEMNCFRLLS